MQTDHASPSAQCTIRDSRIADRQDWSMEGRAQLGHEVLDLAPTADTHPCWTGWYADHLGVDDHRMATMLRPLLDRMSRAGLLTKTGGVEQRGGRTRSGACYYQLAVDRHDAHELWSEIVVRHRWWHHTGRAAA